MTDIPRRTLGGTGLEVTTLGFGAMELRGDQDGPALEDSDAERLLNTVLDEGINFIDTSIDYGRSEELIGKFISHRREEYVLASKCGCVPGAGMGTDHIHTAANIRAGVERSLRLLNTDHLDLVQFHRSISREEFDAEGALSEAFALRDEGKVRFVGVSAVLPNFNEQIDMDVFDAFQVPYSALQRDHELALSRASDAGAGIIIRGGVARGTPDDWEGRRYYMLSNETMRGLWDAAKLDELLDGMSRTAFMLRFTLSHPALDTTIVGTSSVEHLRENIAVAAKGALPDDVLEEAKRRLAAVGAVPLPE
ncbi:MAG TPA: aldo/keto reductase [Solirubrobacteraceae bacterium]|jgi:aryl-alcohol dehydrogenase-like predicted oxidoreductase